MKKRTWLLLLALALLLMAGCSSEKTMGGTITEYLRGDTEVNAFLMEQDGKTIGVRLTGETGIYPALVDITDEALRNAEYPHMEVTVTGEKAEEKLTTADGTEVPTYTASVIIINSIPYGEPLTLDSLPPANTTRWVVRRKAEVVAAVNGGLLTIDEVCERYSLTLEEFASWQRAMDRSGMKGLRVTHVQHYRDLYERQLKY